ncbi:MAG: hypothetical protein QW687_02335 [Candidatus Hadarchaeales archaeon]
MSGKNSSGKDLVEERETCGDGGEIGDVSLFHLFHELFSRLN